MNAKLTAILPLTQGVNGVLLKPLKSAWFQHEHMNLKKAMQILHEGRVYKMQVEE